MDQYCWITPSCSCNARSGCGYQQTGATRTSAASKRAYAYTYPADTRPRGPEHYGAALARSAAVKCTCIEPP